MASETFKKRRKEAERREKQQAKFVRRAERKKERATENKAEGENPKIAGRSLDMAQRFYDGYNQ